MNRKAFKTCVGTLVVGLSLLLAGPAAAQSPPSTTTGIESGDWPNLGTYNNRQGRNADPLAFSSGLTSLRWFLPNTAAQRNAITLDNASVPTANNPYPDAPYDAPPAGCFVPVPVGGYSAPGDTTGWSYPELAKAAESYVTLPRRTTTTPFDRTDRVALYNYATCVPSSAAAGDPTVPETGFNAKIFSWVFAPGGGARNVAVYASLPIGTTDVSPVGSGASARRYAQRYFVYEISFGPDANNDGRGDNGRIIDVVDTSAAGFGYVRLGNGGASTDRVFPYDGINPIRVRLFNTVPRNEDGTLAIDSSITGATEGARAGQVLVYADAVQFQPQGGEYTASPIAFTNAVNPTRDWQVVSVRNDFSAGLSNDTLTQSQSGVVTSYQANPGLWGNAFNPTNRWTYSFAQESASGNTVDNLSATITGPWNASALNPRRVGANYLTTPVTDAVAPRFVRYAPTLDNGTYEVYAYFGGNQGTEQYATAQRVDIEEGGTLSSFNLDASSPRGWVRVGTRRYTNDSENAPLVVSISSVGNAADIAAGRIAYADAVRFVGFNDLAVTSTPVKASALIQREGGGTPQETNVVIVADETGKIHCLDASGRGDGTTVEYWSYPSTADRTQTNYVDPNLSNGIDGTTAAGTVATMPSRFDLSTAAVARVTVAGTPRDYLYIGATNGRVYCIDMTGRGDYSSENRRVGSTRRIWTYPDDYNPQIPTDPIGGSTLGAFRGSIVFGDTAQGANGPTVFVPAREGRIYALNALGDSTTTQTTVRWQYPSANRPTVPSIQMTPTLFRTGTGGRLYFGTEINSSDDTAARLYALDAASGNIVWQYNGGARDADDPRDPAGALRYDAPTVFSTANGYPDTNTLVETFGNFVTGVVAVPATELDRNRSALTGTAVTHVDTLYALNSNGYLYAFDAETGTPITYTDGTGVHRFADDLGVQSAGSLAFTFTTAFSRNGTVTETVPMIVVPGNDGRMIEAYARTEDYNVFDGRLADFNTLAGSITNVAAANNFLFATTSQGLLYAFDNLGAAGNNLVPGVDSGVGRGVPPNDPSGAPFRNLRIKLVTSLGATRLRTTSGTDATGNPIGLETYQNVITNAAYDRADSGPRTRPGFEWGETVYVLVYGFPYATTRKDTGGNDVTIDPPQITISLVTEGKTSRHQVRAMQFREPPNAPPVLNDPQSLGYRQNGYALYGFTFQNAGANSMLGDGYITASISTAAIGTSGQSSEVAQDTRSNSLSRQDYFVANPLSITVAIPGGTNTTGAIYDTIGADLGSDNTNRVNGSPDVGGIAYSRLLASGGNARHGTTTNARVYITDRSLMALVRLGGINNVRMTRTNLQRQGRGDDRAIYRALDSTLYPGFEDRPNSYPNRSLDYPDIGREQVRAIVNNGAEGNPLSENVSLLPPVTASGAVINADNLTDYSQRRMRRTPVDMAIDVPQYQPPVNIGPFSGVDPFTPNNDPNNLTRRRSSSNPADTAGSVPQGYYGRVQAYIDSVQDGRLDTTQREAYRAFNLSVAVQPQLAIQVGTPTVDLGSLASGTGYSPLNPAQQTVDSGLVNAPFSPWNPTGGAFNWGDSYRTITVRNNGNVNLRDLRLAKGIRSDGVLNAWQLNTSDNDPNAWLSAGNLAGNVLAPGNLWGNIDTTFAAPHAGGNNVILPKPRVTDRTPTELVANPYPRANPNLRVGGVVVDGRERFKLNSGLPSVAPKVAVSVPLGFPVGNYSTEIRVIEDFLDFGNPDGQRNQLLDYYSASKAYEAYSDPVTLTFKIRESRMTNRMTPHTAPMLDDPRLLPDRPATTTYSVAGDRFPTKATFRNAAPAAMRSNDGSLVVAVESDRDTRDRTKATVGTAGPSRIYLWGLRSGATSTSGGNSPLYDLSQFGNLTTPTNQWFTPAGVGAYPTNGAALFAGGTPIAETMRFGSPSFPQRGTQNPLSTRGNIGATTSVYMGFTGDAQVQTASGRLTQSRVFVAPVTPNANGNVAVGTPIDLGGDPQTAKGKPSVVQLGANALVFFAETSAGQSGITAARVQGNAAPTLLPLNFGEGFASVFSPSAIARTYVGAQPQLGTIPPQIVELSFAGKLRGRPNAEAYLGRLRITAEGAFLNAQGQTIAGTVGGNAFLRMPLQTNERLVAEGNGVYRARGVVWERRALDANLFDLKRTVNGLPVSILVAGTGTIERQSGLIVYDTRLGGKVYMDPELGTVRFGGAVPGANAELRLTYTPTFLRVTPGGAAAYSAVNGLWDDRYVSEYGYWFRSAGVNAGPTDLLRNDRYVFAYSRGALGGISARPYTTTMRLGLRLPTRIATDNNGNLIGTVTVTNNTRPYQVDPANGRIYFQAEDEGRNVQVTYTGVNEATNTPVPNLSLGGTVSFVLERDENAVAVDEAANDSGLTAFLDPFTYASDATNRRERPPLVWMFYVSTRAGEPDVYFQTIAPHYAPYPK